MSSTCEDCPVNQSLCVNLRCKLYDDTPITMIISATSILVTTEMENFGKQCEF